MPVLFVGHGAPTNAIEKNEFTESWRKLAKKFSKPRGIVCISAHWMREGSAVTNSKRPKTIHDFYGFPPELYAQKYPAPGSPELAEKIRTLVKSVPISLDTEWGYDHGAWSVLKHMYPDAKVPTIQLSLDAQLAPEKMYTTGKELSALRSQGILILGSGNLVHNLMRMNSVTKPHAWAKEFDAYVKMHLENREDKKIIHYEQSPHAKLAHPTNDHYLPLLYILGATDKKEIPTFFNEKIVFGSISMRGVVFGLPAKK